MSLKKGSVMTVVHSGDLPSLGRASKESASKTEFPMDNNGLLWMGMPFRLAMFAVVIGLLWGLIWMIGFQA